MSRKRLEKKSKSKEIARQLGVSRREGEAKHFLREQARITRPQLRLLEHERGGGLLAKFGADREVWAMLYLNEPAGCRFVEAAKLSSKQTQLNKLSYARPGHFVLLFFVVKAGGVSAEKLLEFSEPESLKGLGFDPAASALASEEWETPSPVQLKQAPMPFYDLYAMSLRAVDRQAERVEFSSARHRFTIEVKI